MNIEITEIIMLVSVTVDGNSIVDSCQKRIIDANYITDFIIHKNISTGIFEYSIKYWRNFQVFPITALKEEVTIRITQEDFETLSKMILTKKNKPINYSQNKVMIDNPMYGIEV